MPDRTRPPQDAGPDEPGTTWSGLAGRDRRPPWFGPRRLGLGYGPRTWQGWTVSAVLAGFVITVATVAPHTLWLPVAIVAVIGTPLIIMAVQRR